MIKFRLSTHGITDEPMVEVWRDDTFVASIYGHEDGMKIVSKYLDGVDHPVPINKKKKNKFSK